MRGNEGAPPADPDRHQSGAAGETPAEQQPRGGGESTAAPAPGGKDTAMSGGETAGGGAVESPPSGGAAAAAVAAGGGPRPCGARVGSVDEASMVTIKEGVGRPLALRGVAERFSEETTRRTAAR